MSEKSVPQPTAAEAALFRQVNLLERALLQIRSGTVNGNCSSDDIGEALDCAVAVASVALDALDAHRERTVGVHWHPTKVDVQFETRLRSIAT